MFKRLGVIVLTVLYLITATGFALNLHYCGNFLMAVKINAPATGCSNPMAAKMKCCKDKQLLIKIKDVHQTTVGTALAKINGFAAVKCIFAEIIYNTPLNFNPAKFDRGPPGQPLSTIAVFIKNCTFRI